MDEKEKGHASVWATVLALTPLLYALSIGPVAMCLKLSGMSSPPEWMENFYAPLYWAIEHSKLFESIMDRYGKLLGLD